MRLVLLSYLFIILSSSLTFAQITPKFILSPSNEDFEALSIVYIQSDQPLALQIVYNELTHELAYGIAVPKAARNGIHARLLSIVTQLSLKEIDGGTDFSGATLFLEKQDGETVLSFHGRNSLQSNINNFKFDYQMAPIEVLQAISDMTGLPIVPASEELTRSIDLGNAMRGIEDLKQRHKLKSKILPQNRIARLVRALNKRSKRYKNIGPDIASHSNLVSEILVDRSHKLFMVPRAIGVNPFVITRYPETADEYLLFLEQSLKSNVAYEDAMNSWVDYTYELFESLNPTEIEYRRYVDLINIMKGNAISMSCQSLL